MFLEDLANAPRICLQLYILLCASKAHSNSQLAKKAIRKNIRELAFGRPPGEPRLGSFFLISQNLVYFNCIIIYKAPNPGIR